MSFVAFANSCYILDTDTHIHAHECSCHFAIRGRGSTKEDADKLQEELHVLVEYEGPLPMRDTTLHNAEMLIRAILRFIYIQLALFYIYIYIYVNKYVHINIHIHVHLHVHIHVYICIYILTCTHASVHGSTQCSCE